MSLLYHGWYGVSNQLVISALLLIGLPPAIIIKALPGYRTIPLSLVYRNKFRPVVKAAE